MPTFTYVGDPDLYYPTLALTPKPGESYDLDEDPGDGRWKPDQPAAPTGKAKPAAKEN